MQVDKHFSAEKCVGRMTAWRTPAHIFEFLPVAGISLFFVFQQAVSLYGTNIAMSKKIVLNCEYKELMQCFVVQ